MQIDIRSLSKDERAALDAGIALAKELLGGSSSFSWEEAQSLYDLMMRDRVEPSGDAVIAAGLYFGEVVRLNSQFEWVRVSNEYGDETCLSPAGLSIFCAPISMIQKRLKRREAVNVREVGEGAIEIVRRRIEEGEVQLRDA